MIATLHGIFTAIQPQIPAGIAPQAFYLCIAAAVLITAVSKTGFGGGIGILAIPVMALVVGPVQMLGLMLPLLLICDIFGVLHYRRDAAGEHLRPLIWGALVGVVVGTLILWGIGHMPPRHLNRAMNAIVGGACLAAVLLQAYRLTGRELPLALRPSPQAGASVGLIAGVLTTVNHAAGPIVTVYLLPAGLDKRRLVGTLLWYTLLINAAKLPTFALLPLFDGKPLLDIHTLHDCIWFLPLIPMGTMLGAWMNHRVPPRPFAAIMYAATAAAAAQLLCKALA